MGMCTVVNHRTSETLRGNHLSTHDGPKKKLHLISPVGGVRPDERKYDDLWGREEGGLGLDLGEVDISWEGWGKGTTKWGTFFSSERRRKGGR